MKKLTIIGLIAALLVSTFAGCNSGSGNGGSNAKAEASKNTNEKVSLSICAADNTFGISTDATLQKAVTDLLAEKSNTELTAIIPPVASYNEKIETMISSGDVPDIFCVSQAMTRLPNYVIRGKLLKLDDYIKKSDKLSTIPQDLYDALKVNGSVYHVPYNYPKVKAIFLRKDIMDKYKINLSNTPTTKEFITEMSKLKGTGIKPFYFPKWIDNFQYFMNSFGAYAGVYKNESGKYVDGFQEPQMVEALNYLRELYTSGVMDKEFITTENNTMREAVYKGTAASNIDYVSNYANCVSQTKVAGVPTDMFLIYDLIGPNGKGGGLNESVQTAFVVSADCKKPDRAVNVLETLILDPVVNSAFFNVGVENQHYTVDDSGKLTPTDKAKNSGYSATYSYLYDSFVGSFDSLKIKPNESTLASLDNQKAYIKKAQELKGPKYTIPSGVSTTYDEVSASITSQWKEVVSQIVLGTVTVDQGMANYKNFWNSVNGETILKELNK